MAARNTELLRGTRPMIAAISRKHPIVIAFLLAFLLSMCFQGSRGLWDPDEGRYTAVALEMLRLGDFIHPMLHREHPHYTKPPLTYWAIAASVRLFGRNEWAIRLPYALAFTFTVLLLHGLGRDYQPHRPWLPALVYATSLLPYGAANIVTTDTPLTLWEMLAVFGFLKAYHAQPGQTKRSIALMWLGFALAFLTKGPPGLLPLLAMAVFLLARREWGWLPRAFAPWGLLLFGLIGLSWYLLLVVRTPQLWSYFVEYELVARVTSNAHRRHGEWYGGLMVYLPTLLIGSLPWTLLLVRRFREMRLSRAWRLRGWLSQLPARWQFVLAWLLVPLLVFMLARSRLPLYLLPLFAPLSLVIAAMLPASFTQQRRRMGLWTATVLAVLLALRGFASIIPHKKDARALAQAITAVAPGPYRELIFVDREPRYGLALYLDAEIEHVCLYKSCERAGFVQDQALASEIRQRQMPVLYLMRANAMPAVSQRLEREGIPFTLLGEAQEFSVIEVR